jgi:hypothetical protein
LLKGRIFDDRGNRMTPSHRCKSGTRHRYYVSSALIQGQPETAGSVARVPATIIEAAVVDAVRGRFGHDATIGNAEIVATYVRKIAVKRTEIAISLQSEGLPDEAEGDPPVLTVPWSKTAHRRHHDVIVPRHASPAEIFPIRSDTRAKLVNAIARGRQWLSEIEAGAATVDDIAAREACSKRHVNMTISLAFLAPNLVKASSEQDFRGWLRWQCLRIERRPSDSGWEGRDSHDKFVSFVRSSRLLGAQRFASPRAATRRSTGGPVRRNNDPTATISSKRRPIGRILLTCSSPNFSLGTRITA